MARNLNIAMGTLFIPVKLDNVAREATSNLHEYHKDDMGAGGRKKVCKSCGKDLADTDIVKGLEVTKGNVVTFTKEELASLPLSTTKNVEIDRFIDAKELNNLTFDTGYYVTPREGSDNALNILIEGMKQAGKVAVGKVAIAQRENLCVIQPHGSGLVLTTLYWLGEMKEVPQVPKTQVSKIQLDLIKTVINKYSKPFNHGDYSDKYLDALNKTAQDKLAGKQVVVATAEDNSQQNIEDALRALAEG